MKEVLTFSNEGIEEVIHVLVEAEIKIDEIEYSKYLKNIIHETAFMEKALIYNDIKY